MKDLIRAEQTPEQREIADWIYEATKAPGIGVLVLGMMEVFATDHPDWTYWQCAQATRERCTGLRSGEIKPGDWPKL